MTLAPSVRNLGLTFVVLVSLVSVAASQMLLGWHGRSLFSYMDNQDKATPTLPLSFEQNSGQANPTVKFVTHGPGGLYYFTEQGLTLALDASTRSSGSGIQQYRFNGVLNQASAAQENLSQVLLQMRFINANEQAVVEQGKKLPGLVNYFVGSDPAKWHSAIPTFSQITYRNLYPGVDLTYSGDTGQLKGTYVLAPSVDPATISWRYEGTGNPKVDSSGNLLLSVGALTLTEHAPISWQMINGKRQPVAVSYMISSQGSIGFALGAYNASYPLVIDPSLTYSTYLGGSADDVGYGIRVDASGNTYITGRTASANFPLMGPYQATYGGGQYDAFVSKIDPSGSTLLYSTYLGGGASDLGWNITVDSEGNAYVVGNTGSSNFPLMNPVQPTYGGGSADAFITKLNATGSALLFSSFLGGSDTFGDFGNGVELDGAGNVYVAGFTYSSNFPVVNPIQPSLAGSNDGFITKFNPALTSILYSTYLGGSSGENLTDLTVDPAGSVYVGGFTGSTNFPVVSAFQPVASGGGDGFVTKINPPGTALLYSTYIGGNSEDTVQGIVVNSVGEAYLTGNTSSTNFPLMNPMQPTYAGGAYDAFVTKLNGTGGVLVYSTFVGGSGSDIASRISVDATGSAYLVGGTSSTNYPVVNPIQAANAGGEDAFLTKLNPLGSAFVYSTYLGGTLFDFGDDVSLSSAGAAQIVGYSGSTNFPVVNAIQPNYGGGSYDAFIAKIVETPPPTATATPTSTSTPTSTNTTTSTPTIPATSTATRSATSVSTNTPTPCPISFTDVHTTDYFYISVQYLYCRGVISGYSDNTFRPYNDTTRGQLTKIVVLAEGFSINTTGGPHFTDVPASNPFYAFIETAYNRGLISGYSDGTFRWGANVTRGQLSKIVVLAQAWPIDTTGGPHFTDVPASNSFYNFVETAFHHGVISGYSDGTFRPNNNATRGQISKIVYTAITQP